MKNNDIGIVSVSQLNYYIKSLLDGDKNLINIFVRGEISNFTNHYRSGHLYFSLKDENSIIKAVMFSTYSQRLKFMPKDGMQVIIRGRVSAYEVSGQYQLYVEDMQPDGLGALNLAYEQLKKKLSAEGLFDEENKKKLPRFPKSIGVVTSPTGAAIKDIESILKRRFPLAKVIVCPVLVQREKAANQIAEAIDRFNELNAADVLIVGRGGGSPEDLWAFNEEVVARSIYKSSIPVISAVGHETDFTICDFVADLRAPTPSAAAEIVVPDCNEIYKTINSYLKNIKNSVNYSIEESKIQLDILTNCKAFKNPNIIISNKQLKVDELSKSLKKAFENILKEKTTKLIGLSDQLNILNPENVLKRGYSIIIKKQKAIKSIKSIKCGENVNIKLADGEIECKINDIRRIDL